MQTIVEPKQHIDKLWGKQRIRGDETYRLMKYVLRVDHEGKVLLHNVVTGRLVVLEHEEAAMLENLPVAYSPVMEQLVTEHYLVPEDYDEHRQVVRLRTILQQLIDAQQKPGITKFTILPTTACNARCYYCYEHGIVVDTMTERVTDDVVRFITAQSRGQRVRIRWFGGEPTLAADCIDRISSGLNQAGVVFSSNMISNGYLFDEKMVQKAKTLWNLYSIKISIDGVKETYNRTKSFVGVRDDPYERVLRNIELFLNAGIRVSVFVNFDRKNEKEFVDVLSEFKARFGNKASLRIQSHQLILDHIREEATESKTEESWYQTKVHELNDMSRQEGFLEKQYRLPYLEYRWCEAASGSAVTIMPKGTLVSCPEQLSDDQIIGDLEHGVTNEILVCSWRKYSDNTRCHNCSLFPDCQRILNCASSDRCFTKIEKMDQYITSMVHFSKQ